jgi:transposase InsO family protein
MTLTEQYPVEVVCSVMNYPRSTYYHQKAQMSSKKEDSEQALRQALLRLAAEWPTYGYQRLTAQLKREGWDVNSKRVRRLMHELNVMAKPVVRKRHTTQSKHPFPRYPNLVRDIVVTYPEQVWVADITYIRLGSGFVYLAILMDVFTRSIRGWHLSRNLDQQLTLTALTQAREHGSPAIHHSDQGVQYATSSYIAQLEQMGTQISMAEVGEPTQNGYAERLIRTIKEEEVDISEYQSFADVVEHIGQFLGQVYMHKRIHSSLGYLTPSEFEQQWQKQRERTEMPPSSS